MIWVFGGCGGGQMYQNCYFVLLYNAQNTYGWFISVGEIFVAHANLYRFSMNHTKYGFFDRSMFLILKPQ